MKETKDFGYYEFEVGRYEPYEFESAESKRNFKPYKEDKTKLVWNVFYEDFNDKNHPIKVINLFEFNWVFLKDGILYAKKHFADNYIKFANHIRNELQHEYWARCEYETIITTWPCMLEKKDIKKIIKDTEEHPDYYRYDIPVPGVKIDVYTQVMMNWDRFINYVWENKKLITKKKLGLN